MAAAAQLLAYMANLPASLIGLEACCGAYFLGAALREQGHEVRLIPAQFVKPYRKSNKNDFLDAEAIAEAVTAAATAGGCLMAVEKLESTKRFLLFHRHDDDGEIPFHQGLLRREEDERTVQTACRKT
jgi:transposase